MNDIFLKFMFNIMENYMTFTRIYHFCQYEYWFKKNIKKWFWKRFFRLMNNSVFGKTMENFQIHRGVKLKTTEKKRNYLMSERNQHTTKFSQEIY